MTAILLYVSVSVFTVALPWWSLLLFVMVSPWNVLGEWTGVDVRLAWSIMLAIRAGLVFGDPPRRALSPATVTAAIAFTAIGYIRLHFGTADLPSEDLTGAYRTLLYFVSGACSVYSILKLSDSPGRMATLVTTAGGALILASSFGLFQAATGYGNELASGRISGAQGNANFYAAYLSLGATLAIIASRLEIGGRWLQRLAAIIAAAACVLTFSRMGIVACFLGAGLALRVRRHGPVFHWKLIASAVGIAVLAAVFSSTYLADSRRGVSLSKDPAVEQASQFGQAVNDWSRLEAAQFALQEWTANPIWGAGLATLAARNYMANGIYVTTHNTYVQVLAGTGIAGAALCALALYSLLSTAAPARKRYMIPAVAALGLCCFFADFLGSIEVSVLMAILLAMLRCAPAGSPMTATPAVGIEDPPYLGSGPAAVVI
jgi:hypothetical protein